MRVDIILADHAQATPDGKVGLLGAGWTFTRGGGPMAVTVFVEVPWDNARPDVEHTLALELLDADGRGVSPGPMAPPLRVEAGFRCERPDHLPAGAPVAMPPLAVNLHGLALPPGRYTWRASVDGESNEAWTRSFTRIE